MKNTGKDWKKVKEQPDLDESDLDTAATDTESNASEEEAVALDHPSYEMLEQKLTQAEQKAHDNWEKLVRSMAEVDNIRRRAQRDIDNARLYALEKYITMLLPVADSLEHAIALAEKQADVAMREGLEITMKLFLDALEKAGVNQIDPLGRPFDPQAHEAMSMQESDDVAANTVLVVFQKGYLLNERVIRPARVVVSKQKSST